MLREDSGIAGLPWPPDWRNRPLSISLSDHTRL
jgi:hypothetical protein